MSVLDAEVPAEFEDFRRRAHRLTGLDLSSYKAPQMHRRLTSLLTRLNVAGFDAYARLLETSPERRQEFRDYVTINVSEFFRDTDRFGDLERRVLPDLLRTGNGLRVWSAGCSIGAEPYSLAILLNEQAPQRVHSILATDVDQTVLNRARAAVGYLPGDLRNAGRDRVQRWFTADAEGRYALGPVPRAMVRFVKHDLLTDAYPAGPFDLIACRNVVIYFTEAAKDRIFDGFVSALRPGGVLFLGGTEAIMRPQALGLTVMGAGFYRRTTA